MVLMEGFITLSWSRWRGGKWLSLQCSSRYHNSSQCLHWGSLLLRSSTAAVSPGPLPPRWARKGVPLWSQWLKLHC